MEEIMQTRINKLFCLKLSFEEKIVLLALLEHSNIDGICPSDKSFFSEKLGISKWKFSKLISQLNRGGYLECSSTRKYYKIKF